jgi:hypothetical protein
MDKAQRYIEYRASIMAKAIERKLVASEEAFERLYPFGAFTESFRAGLSPSRAIQVDLWKSK